jgi:hypothetical protein
MYPKSWQRQVLQALLLLVGAAFVARMVYEWLTPLVPGVMALAVLLIVFRLVLGRRWR